MMHNDDRYNVRVVGDGGCGTIEPRFESYTAASACSVVGVIEAAPKDGDS